MKKSRHVRMIIEHLVKMKEIGPCPLCAGTAKIGDQWCKACGLTGRRDEYEKRRTHD